MPHAKFNWRCGAGGGGEGEGSASSTSPQNPDGTFSFPFGETWKLTNHTLARGENAKGCTLDVMLEHDSKVSQLQLVCSASGLQVLVVQKMNGTDFKWLTQMRGTPLPNQPDLFYFRTPEELLTQKIWRLRVKFLFSSASVVALRVQSLSLSFDKLTRKASAGKGAYMGGVPLLLSAPSGSGKPHLYRGSSMSTVTSTTASLSTTPTGTCTPNGSDTSLCEDMSELSLHGSDAEGDEGASTRSTRSARSSSLAGAAAGGVGSTSTSSLASSSSRVTAATAMAPIVYHSSGASVSSVRSSRSSGSSASSASSHHRRRTTGSGCGSPPPASSSSDRAAVRQLLAVIDQVLAGRGPTSAALSAELVALRGRLTEHLSGDRRLSDQELTQTVGRIGAVVQSLASG